MNPTRPLCAVLLLCVLTLHTLSHSLILPGYQSDHFQTTISGQLSCTDALTSDLGGDAPAAGDWKPPKHSFIDYSTYLAPDSLLASYHPFVSGLMAYERRQAPPQVYLEIVVPPDHA